MRIANVGGRLALLVDLGAIDVETASGGRFTADPQVVYERWPSSSSEPPNTDYRCGSRR